MSSLPDDAVLTPRGFIRARKIYAGDLVRFTDVEGQQVADIVLLRAGHSGDWLSCVYTKLLNGTDRISTGHVLYSKSATPLATVVEDSVGLHWFGGGFCSEETNRFRYGVEGTVNCRSNLAASLADYVSGPMELELDSCASLFMNIAVEPDHTFTIRAPSSQPGNFIEFRAECDLILGVSNCPADQNACNNFEPTSMRVAIVRGDAAFDALE